MARHSSQPLALGVTRRITARWLHEASFISRSKLAGFVVRLARPANGAPRWALRERSATLPSCRLSSWGWRDGKFRVALVRGEDDVVLHPVFAIDVDRRIFRRRHHFKEGRTGRIEHQHQDRKS